MNWILEHSFEIVLAILVIIHFAILFLALIFGEEDPRS